MIRTFRYPLHPTSEQATVLGEWFAQCCRLYNGALEHRKWAWEQGESITRYTQQVQLTQLRAECPDWNSVPVQFLRSALARVDRSFQAFFRRCREGGNPGYPRFKSEHGYCSVVMPHAPKDLLSIRGTRIKIPKMGYVKMRMYRPLRGKPLETRIHKTAGRWYVCIVCDLGDAPAKTPVHKATGIDLGLKTFAVLSDGREVDNPKFFQSGESRVRRCGSELGRKIVGSKTWTRTKNRLARAHEHIKNQRLDHARKLSAELYKEFDLVAYENLDIVRMIDKTKGFSKPIADAAWGVFLRCLTSKAENAGKWAVPVDPRGTSQRCSQCGATVTKVLAEREHRCACGFVTSRDHNAALNVLALGQSAVQLAEGTLTEPALELV